MSTSFSEGDIVLVDFEAWTDDGDLFDTTREAVAKEAGWDLEEQSFDPLPVVLGAQRVVPGFEAALLAADLDEEKEVEVPPGEAFGEHNPDRVRVFPRRDFEKKEIDPYPGTRVEMGGKRGTVVQATASRVRVDFNHPFAGKTLTYKFKIVERVEGDEDRLRALLKLDYGIKKAEGLEVEVDGTTATIRLPESAMFDTEWFMAKHRLGHSVFEHTELETVELVESLTREDFEAHDHGHGHAHPAVEDAVEDAGDEGAEGTEAETGDEDAEIEDEA